MENINKLKESAKDYIIAHDKRNERFLAWTTGGIADFVKTILEEIKDIIVYDNDFFKSNLYVSESFTSFNSTDNVTKISKPMRIIILKSGNIVAAGFQSENGRSFDTISESGFEIHFSITLNGKIHVYALGHCIKDKEAEFQSIEIINHPNLLNKEKIIDLVVKGIEFAKTTSFLLQ